MFTSSISDSLVLHLQLLYDGYLPGGTGGNDTYEDFKERLSEVQQRR